MVANSAKGPTEVAAYAHDETRPNIPTADAAAEWFDDENSILPPVPFERFITEPQLVWRGKADETLFVDAPPIYIQEKVDPRAIITNLRKQSRTTTSEEPSLFNFEDFDQLDELSAVEFYQHEESWKNRMILGDSLQVMGSLAEREALRGKVQMIYIDPPYGIKFGSNWQVRTNKRNVKDGKLEDAAREAEQIKAFRDTWELGIHSYLSYLRDRLLAAQELLLESGSVFVQIGDENVHLVRSLLDEVFGPDNFVSQITYKSTAGLGQKYLAGASNYILWYAKAIDRLKYRQPYESKDVGDSGAALYSRVMLPDGSYRPISAAERVDPKQLPAGSHLFRPDNLVSQRPPQGGDLREFLYRGKNYTPGKGVFKTDKSGLERLAAAYRLWPTAGGTLQYIRYLDDFTAIAPSNVWTDTGTGSFTEDKVYVVQTGTKIVQRCMIMSTDPGDLVLDPTCGSGTTAFVAEQWGRRWITIDTSRVALALARQRLMGSRFPYYIKTDSAEGRRLEGLPPASTSGDLREGFVYEKVQHITLRSIANNPDIRDGMRREEIDEVLKKHADFELLYDKPKVDRSRVRVSGLFTVESLSPHRSVSFSEAEESLGVDDEAVSGFDDMIIANLRRAGIQNGKKAQRIDFESLEAYSGEYLQAIGDRKGIDEESAGRVAIALGPQYGTVSPGYIKAAAKEALANESVDLLCVLGFAFDPLATGVTEDDGVTVVEEFASVEGERKLGRIQVLLVRMNADLLMGEELKKTGSGNLFTVFGEPDVEVREIGDQYEVELKGVDVYDPTTGDVRSKSTREIALWMLDTDYDGESFFVRHAYFTGDNDPFKSLKIALRADIDESAWATLYRTISIPFDAPTTGKIAIKVINDYGDEVMKVIEV